MSQRQSFDIEAYVQRSQHGPCFICEIVAGNPEYHHHVIYENDVAIVFLNKYPTLRGYTLVAPKEHRERVTGDFTLDEYLALQQLIYRVAEALRRAVPYEEQQIEALRFEHGVLELSHEEMASLAQRIRQEMIDG